MEREREIKRESGELTVCMIIYVWRFSELDKYWPDPNKKDLSTPRDIPPYQLWRQPNMKESVHDPRNELDYTSCKWISYIERHHPSIKSFFFLTSPSTAASWLPKLLPTNLLPSSKYKVANAVGGSASSPDWVAMKRDATLRLPMLLRPRWESDDRRDERGRSMVIILSWWWYWMKLYNAYENADKTNRLLGFRFEKWNIIYESCVCWLMIGVGVK